MELYRLAVEEGYQPNTIVEGWDSLVWTERYRDASDFQLTSTDIKAMRSKLPIGAIICLRDSREVMLVETHEIQDNQSQGETLTITGRSFETFYENRTTLTAPESINDSGGDANDITIENHSSSYAALLTLNRAKSSLVDATNGLSDVAHGDITTKTLPLRDRTVERGPAYDAVIKILAEDDLGIRNERPKPNFSTINVLIYNGVDRSASIIFDVRLGHFDSAKYLWSNKGYKTAVYSSTTRYFTRTTKAGTSAYTDLNRRVGLLDNSDITKAGTKYLNAAKSRGRSYLAKNKKTLVFEGNVSDDIPFKISRDYNVGDIVLCMGDYDVNQKLMVTEYVRTQDAGVEKAYPTLSAIGGDYDDD